MQTEEKKYIGIFNDSFPPIIDGVTQTILSYVDWLKNHGYDPCVVTPSNPVKIDVPYKVIRYFSLPIPSRNPYRYGYPKLDPFIWGKMRNTPFRLIHSHSPFAAGRLGVYAKKKQGIPLIGTFHSKYKSDLKHSFRYLPWGVPIIMKRILNFYNACDEVWIPQASVEDTIREYGFKGRVEVVENGIDYGDIPVEDIKYYKSEARKELSLQKDELSLLFVGQHIWEKGIKVIVEALKLLDPNVRFRMTFIGEGYAKKDLKSLIANYGLDSKTQMLDLVTDRETLRKYYASADLFLFPSRYDNAPLVVREAASMETPSIIPTGATASEVITHNSNGFLCDDTPEAYASLITELYNDRARLEKVALESRLSLVRGWEDVMEEIEDRYKNLIRRFEKDRIHFDKKS